MATEEQKKARELRLFNDIITGFAKGLYDLFGDTALATVETIGKSVLEEMERELGLEIQGESSQDILTEIGRLLVDEYGLVKDSDLTINDETRKVHISCTDCSLWKSCKDLSDGGITPYTCVPMMMATAALRQRRGQRVRFAGIEQNVDKRLCDIHFQMID